MATEPQVPSGRTLVYPMIGHPIAQVKSPTTFNRYFWDKRIDAVMIPIDVHPAEVVHFFSFLRGWRNCPGCVITVPHKQEAARQADELSPRARDLGAVNVIRRTATGRFIGDMVDGLGFMDALRRNGFDVKGKRAVVFGAGGAGGAIVYALAEARAASLVVIDPDGTRQQHLLDLIALRYPEVALSQTLVSLAGFDLAVNASTVGMDADPNTPYPLDSLQPGTFVADVVTSPEITPWLEGARERGCRIQTGYEMTLGQFKLMGRHMGIIFEEADI
ncbi:MAG: shikimate dehydrogenase [Thermodesulfobacteriota bacterium]